MENNKEQALNQFLNVNTVSTTQKNKKEVVINEREGLIERIDPIYVTKEGKQLLREQY